MAETSLGSLAQPSRESEPDPECPVRRDRRVRRVPLGLAACNVSAVEVRCHCPNRLGAGRASGGTAPLKPAASSSEAQAPVESFTRGGESPAWSHPRRRDDVGAPCPRYFLGSLTHQHGRPTNRKARMSQDQIARRFGVAVALSIAPVSCGTAPTTTVVDQGGVDETSTTTGPVPTLEAPVATVEAPVATPEFRPRPGRRPRPPSTPSRRGWSQQQMCFRPRSWRSPTAAAPTGSAVRGSSDPGATVVD